MIIIHLEYSTTGNRKKSDFETFHVKRCRRFARYVDCRRFGVGEGEAKSSLIAGGLGEEGSGKACPPGVVTRGGDQYQGSATTY